MLSVGVSPSKPTLDPCLESPCLVSVVVPTRNRADLLTRMLAAVRSQTMTHFEVIVVDDASNASTRSMYEQLWLQLDSRFRLIQLGNVNGPGVGPSIARNTGIEAARGAVITFCDDDDFWTSDGHLASMVDVFQDDPEIDMYIANQRAVSCDGHVEQEHWLPALVDIVGRRSAGSRHGHRVSVEDLAQAGGFAQLNILALRRQIAVKIDGFWSRTSYEEDRDFFWRAADAARVIFFNPQQVAQHNVPDPKLRNNLSRSFSQAERWLLSTLVSQHIAMNVSSPVIRKLCHAYEGDILRHLSQYWIDQGKPDVGLQYARRALAARGSFKWALYTGLLACRKLGRKEAA